MSLELEALLRSMESSERALGQFPLFLRFVRRLNRHARLLSMEAPEQVLQEHEKLVNESLAELLGVHEPWNFYLKEVHGISPEERLAKEDQEHDAWEAENPEEAAELNELLKTLDEAEERDPTDN